MHKQPTLVVLVLAIAISIVSACLKVNCGGGALPGGIMADNPEFYSKTSAWVGKYDSSSSQASVFDSHSWTPAKDLIYTFSPPPNDTYTVQLQFAENWRGAAREGARVLNVSINGVLISSNLDVWTKSGRKLYAPVVLTSDTVVPRMGEIDIRITRVKGNPFISGIRICRSASVRIKEAVVSSGPVLKGSGTFRTADAIGNPAARHEACAVMVAGKVYLIGGRDTRPVDVYDPVSGLWESRRAPEEEMNHMQCVAYKNRYVYIAGAWYGGWPFEKTHNKTFIYDTVTDAWSTAPGLGKRARGGGALAEYKGKLYLAMGNRGGHGAHATTLAEFDEYDPVSKKWKALPPAPDARDHTGGGIIGDRFCIAGGRDGGSADALSTPIRPVNCYNFRTGKWERRASIPEGRAGASTGVTCQGLLMVAGGEGLLRNGTGKAFSRVDLYDVESDRFLKPVYMREARHGSGVAVADCSCGNIYIPSGSGDLGGGPELNTTEVWSPDGVQRKC